MAEWKGILTQEWRHPHPVQQRTGQSYGHPQGWGFCSLARFAHLGENYSLKVGFHIDRESLRAGEKASLLIRPSLRINGFPTSLKLLEGCKLVLITFDHDNQPTRMEVPIDQLDSTKEYVHEFRVPERMQRLQAFLEAKVENLSAKRKPSI